MAELLIDKTHDENRQGGAFAPKELINNSFEKNSI